MLANHKGEVPFLVLLLPFLLGIALGLSFGSGNFLFWVFTPLLVAGAVFVILNSTYAFLNIHKYRWIGGVLIHIILLLVGWFSVIVNYQLNKRSHFSKQVGDQLIVKVNSEPVIKNGVIRFTASVEQVVDDHQTINTTGTLLVAIKDSLAAKLAYGDKVLLPAKHTTVDRPFNPAEFNYKRYLANQNIFQQVFLYPGQYRIISRNGGNPIIAYALNTRQHLIDKLKRGMRDTAAISVASTLILGYKADLSEELLQAYSKTGTIHILSVSGGHVAIIYLLLNIAFSFLGRHRYGRLLKSILIIAFIWGYAVLTGLSPAVSRAAVMISFVITGTTYNRYINTLNILAVSAFFMLLYNPFLIVDVGFQLSYLAVAGMVVLQPVIYNMVTANNKWLNKLWAVCTISIAAQAITFPLSALYFHQFPIYFLVSNLFILIPAEIILCAGMLYLLLPDITFISTALVWITEKTIILMNKVLIIIEHAPFAFMGKIWLNGAEHVLLSVAIIALFYFMFDAKRKALLTGLVAILVLCVSVSFKRFDLYKNDSIAFMSLRKNKGIVFKHGDGATILTNLSPADKNYRYSVQPYLDSCKINDTAVYTFYKSIQSSSVRKQGNLIQFKNKRIVIIDGPITDDRLPKKIKVDYLYLTGNPHVNLSYLSSSFTYNKLIVDGSNTAKRVTDIAQQVKDLHISCYILKGNDALIIPVN